ncbi:hypothetical protein EPN96_12360 [bacterium]|nr:MAG: hypothetical protein EPN96_12360 [bacterium]
MKISAKTLPLLCLALFLAASCAQKPKEPAHVAGKVLRHGQGVPMAMVQFYPRADQDRSTPPVAEVPSAADGSFTLDIGPGRYWVWAKATLTEGSREIRLIGEAVPNPVEPKPGEKVFVNIELADPSGFSASTGPEGTGIRGRVVLPESRDGATIYVYKGMVEKPIGPGFLVAVEVADNREFRISLLHGAYTLAVRQRKSGKDYGPPESSDLVAVRRLEVSEGSYADTGEIALAQIDEKQWSKVTATMGSSTTSIEGVVVDSGSKPVEGVRILAFRDGRMTGKPAFVSPPSGKDGKFVLPLSREDGNYYLGARSKIGGPSSPGEKVGQHRGEKGSGINVKAGQKVTGLRVLVEEVW